MKRKKQHDQRKRLVPERFYRYIKVFGKEQSERIPIRKV